MVVVTERAKSALLDLKIAHEVRGPETGLRLAGRSTGGIGLVPGEAKPDDQVVEYEGTKVLLIGPEIARPLAGKTIDCVSTPQGRQLVIAPTAPGEEGSGPPPAEV